MSVGCVSVVVVRKKEEIMFDEFDDLSFVCMGCENEFALCDCDDDNE